MSALQAVTEGVIQFRADHHARALRDDELGEAWRLLNAWRTVLFDVGLLGQRADRYDGAGFGNVSVRLDARRFLVTGSQTGHHRVLPADGWCVVNAWDLAANTVRSEGPVLPSSESLTHAMLYALDDAIRAVVHVHDPATWHHASALCIPTTPADVGYGTVEMARAVERLWTKGTLATEHILSMAGHQDGIIGVGADADQAAARVLTWHARAMARQG